jgi:hypothetical protein
MGHLEKCGDFTEENINSSTKAHTELKNFVRQYKNQYFYNCLLWIMQDIEFRTFRRINLAVFKKERGQ